ncbi:MAG: acyltransferase [Betaproteobacteria bacterium]|nr:acyltransferase [Betaproteobacteria bacterium]
MSDRSPRLYCAGLTGLRAYAALWVMLFHFISIVGPTRLSVAVPGMSLDVTPLVTIGWVGVDLFFVLSGFLLTTHLLERWGVTGREALMGSYFRARVLRVFPAYWVQLAILFAVAVIARGGAPAWSGYLPLHVPMLQNLSEKASFAINPVYWTLPIEFAFYLCLPAIARYLAAGEAREARTAWVRLAVLVMGLIATTWAYRYVVFRAYEGSAVNTIAWATSQIPGTLDQFMIGSGTAAGYRLARSVRAPGIAGTRAWHSTALFAIGLCGVVAMMYFIDRIHGAYWSGHWALFVWHTITAAFIACIVLSIVISSPSTRLVFENRIALFLGTISYSIYLWHFPIAIWAAGFLEMSGMELWRFSLLVAPPVIVASACSYYGVERPFLKGAGAKAQRG